MKSASVVSRREWLAGTLLLASGAARADTRQERGKKVLDAALEALGGNKFLTMRDRVESGRVYSFYREELSGLSVAKIYTRYTMRPDSPPPDWIGVRERQSFGKKDETSAVLFTGDAAYQVSFRGARPVPDDVLDRYKASFLHNIFYILRQRLGEPGLLFELQSSDVWENQPVNIVDITDSENRVVTVYFHHLTALPVRQIFYRRDPKTRDRIEEIAEFAKYRDAGGIQWPFTVRRIRDGERIFESFSENVAINQGLPEKLFTLPPGAKVLKKGI